MKFLFATKRMTSERRIDLDSKATRAFALLRAILTGTEQRWLHTNAGSFTFDSRRATLCTYA